MRWTQEQFDEYQMLYHKGIQPNMIEEDPGPESRLRIKIETWCKEWGRPCLSFRQSHKAKGFLSPGWPDMTIAMPKGKTLFIELKSKRGRLSAEQKQVALQLMSLGHSWFEIRSFKRFLEVVSDNKG